jgi:small subunit ribosomal protein S11
MADPTTPPAPASATPDAAAPAAGPRLAKKKIRKKVPVAYVHVHAGENNTIVTFTDPEGATLGWASCGSSGFNGTRKSTPYAAKVAAETAAGKIVQPYGIESVHVRVKGFGPGREQAIRGLQGAGLNLESIADVTPVAHGGVRQRRRRRV